MKIFRFITFVLVLSAAFTVAVSAQTTTTPSRIGVIDTRFFLDGQNGIKRYVDAFNVVNTEFKPMATDLDTLGARIQNLEKELAAFKAQVEKNVPVNQTTVNTKLEEYDKLTREYKFKREDSEAKYNRRQETLLTPIRQDISTALQEFAKKNGFVVIIDISKDQTGFFVAFDDKVNVTKDFISFYNARPATTR